MAKNTIIISLEITKEMNDWLEKMKKKTLKSKSATIRDIVNKHIENSSQ